MHLICNIKFQNIITLFSRIPVKKPTFFKFHIIGKTVNIWKMRRDYSTLPKQNKQKTIVVGRLNNRNQNFGTL